MNHTESGSLNLTRLDWGNIQTVLLDMDGTLLDLNYDNKVWNELVPTAFAQRHGLAIDDARTDLLSHMREIRGTIDFYSFDYWIAHTGIDLQGVHRQATDLIAFRRDAREFLTWLQEHGHRSIIATNAHWDSIKIKDEFSGVCSMVDSVVSSHDYGHPKEDPGFWEAISDDGHLTDRSSTLFIDDNEDVLSAAAEAGIGYILCVSTPDSNRAERSGLKFPSFSDFQSLYR